MFERFESAYTPDEHSVPSSREGADVPSRHAEVDGLLAFLALYAGKSFNNGLFRVHRWEDLARWKELVTEAWPEAESHVSCLGSSAFGDQFLVTSRPAPRLGINNNALIAQIDMDSVLYTDMEFTDFCEHEIVDHPEAALTADNYRAWLASGGPAPRHHQCIGMKKPMFLGGADDLGSNCEIIDMEVHWAVTAPLARAARGLPEGTRIGKITVEE